ncbi:transcription termination/antitermination protein NusG [Methylacidimicrobium tartarophylax]|uniref:transcription termination/antitermination protein NusG n=1 Tax=Methylacidimicrobium tartarophylax TaxID=1041768 RepID=UPI0015B65550|nr:transcription termination/antitermination NusG family protein [Methylacidimicrobium tartarophylax]
MQTQPKRERIAHQSLLQFEDVESLLPLIRYRRLRKDKQAWTTEPLFPGYLFACFEPLLRLNAVRYAQGVAKIVHFGGRYPLIPCSATDQLRQLLGPDHQITLESNLEPGMEVKIGTGPFRGLDAVVRKFLPGKERVRILLDWLGRQIETEVSSSDVVLPDLRATRKSVLESLGVPTPGKGKSAS